MVVVYGVLLALMTLLLIIKRNYKNNIRTGLNKKEHRLKKIYGLAMFLLDLLPKGLTEKNSKVIHKVQSLSVRENVRLKVYIYNAQKMAIAIIVLYVGLVVGLLCCLSEKDGMLIKKTLERGKISAMYMFKAQDEKGAVEDVSLEVAKRAMTEKEKYKKIKKAYSLLKKKALGKNKTWNHIDRPLNLVSEIGGVKIVWEISDSKVVGYDGIIAPEVKKQIVNFRVTMELQKTKKDYNFAGRIFTPKESSSLEEQLQAYVDKKGTTKKKVKLPEKINGHSYVFFEEATRYAPYVLPLCIALAIFIFVAKDKDLDKEVQERNNQLIRDYPEIISQLLIFLGAGLSFKSAMERIVNEYKKVQAAREDYFHYAYEEMDVALGRIKNGVSESKAIAEFGKNCNVHCYVKLANILEQNIKRGTKEMVFALKSEVNYALNERKNNALKAGSEISTKLLGPMVVMLVIAIVVILAPALLTMNI